MKGKGDLYHMPEHHQWEHHQNSPSLKYPHRGLQSFIMSHNSTKYLEKCRNAIILLFSQFSAKNKKVALLGEHGENNRNWFMFQFE